MKSWLLGLVMTTAAFAAEIEGETGGGIRVIPVDPTPEPNEVSTHISFPIDGEIRDSNPVTIQIRLDGYPLGFYSQFPRTREVRNSKEGQSLHLLIDDRPYVEINEPIDDVGDSDTLPFDQILTTKLPFNLKKGIHVIRAFPVRSFGECLKGDGAFAVSYFYMDKKEGSINLTKPYLTYNQPVGAFTTQQPILLDFYISNCQLSRDGYKVRLTIDRSDKRILTQWVPYYIYGLSRGTHTIRLELLDPNGSVMTPLFNDTQKTITVH